MFRLWSDLQELQSSGQSYLSDLKTSLRLHMRMKHIGESQFKCILWEKVKKYIFHINRICIAFRMWSNIKKVTFLNIEVNMWYDMKTERACLESPS